MFEDRRPIPLSGFVMASIILPELFTQETGMSKEPI